MHIQKVCILGGGGFVGHHLASQLAERGIKLVVTSRHRERVKDLVVLPTAEVIESDIHDANALRALFQGVDAVINLVGILHGSRQAFERAHVELPAKIVAACREAGVKRLLHMSALGASADSKSVYQRTKAQGEALVLAAHRPGELDVTVFRPSVIYGPGDSFLCLFTQLLKSAPIIPLAGAASRFQPVYVQDVARAFVESLDKPEAFGQTYPLCGPKAYSLEELLRLVTETLGIKRTILPLGSVASYLLALFMEFKPGRKLMTRDNYYAMQADNTCAEGFPALFGTATPLEAMLGYIKEQDPRRRYDAYRSQAHR